jgi:glutamate/tyrosine decarboxylase-like PLP-dependent enzyme
VASCSEKSIPSPLIIFYISTIIKAIADFIDKGTIMKDLLERTTRHSTEYLDSLPNRKVFPSAEAVNALKQFSEPLPIEPTDPEKVIDILHAVGSPAAVANAGGRYFGFVIGGSVPASLAAHWLAGAWDQNAGLEVTSPVSAALENACVPWLRELLNVPTASGIGFVTGATMANFSSLVAARNALLRRNGWDVHAKGLFGAPPIRVIVGEEVHSSVLKALDLTGMGRDRVEYVPADEQGRMRPDKIGAVDDRTIVCLQAGNVNTGAFDPAHEIIPTAHSAGAWVHVDGAFGLWAAVSAKRKYLLQDYESADSWATDAHKWLNVPYDSGIVIVKNASDLVSAMLQGGAYLDQSGARIPYQYTPELSRKGRGTEIWAAIKSLGRKGLEEMIERNCRQASRFAERLTKAGFSVLNDVVLNQVLVSFGTNERTSAVIAAVQQDGTCWCGGTVWKGKTAMRISVSSWATTDDDVERSADAIIRAAASVK